MLIDTHAHLNFQAFKDDVDEVLKKTLENNIWVINVGTQYETSKKAIEIAKRYPQGVWAVVGLHPIHLETGLVKIKNDEEEIEVKTREENFDYQKYKDLVLLANKNLLEDKSKKVVAIGEIGLDYYWQPKTTKKKELFRQKQKDLLLSQLKLARELNLPVIFHCRMAHQDLYEVLKSEIRNSNTAHFQWTGSSQFSSLDYQGMGAVAKFGIKGVMHGFVGNVEQLKKYLELGLFIGFNGIIFKKIEGINFEEIIKNTPLDRILIETDCPYLTPPQVEGRNEPIYLKYIIKEIAKIKGLSVEEVISFTTENARKLFQI